MKRRSMVSRTIHKKAGGILLAFVTLLMLIATCGCINEQKNTIKISGAFALYPMMGIWADEYQKVHPEIKIDLSAGGAGKGMSDALMGIVDIGMVSREIYQVEIDQGVFWVSVAKDAVVATINSENPVVDALLEQGVTKQQLERIFISRELETWGEVIGNTAHSDQIRVYTRSDSCGAAQTWAGFLGDYTQDDLTNAADSAINGDPNLAAAVQGDSNAIGYNNINFVYDPVTKEPYNGLLPLPIDFNGDGHLGENESFYGNRTTIVHAIARNLYPSPPSRDLHLVTKHNFTGATKDFIRWILTDGQSLVPESGYIELSQETLTQQLNYLETGMRPELS
jgi:phosphate transport system substrate-binding protein